LILPAIQLVVAATLLQWGYHSPAPRGSEVYVPTTRLICQGLNAPALLFRFFNPIGWGQRFDRIPRWIFGFDTDDLFFLAGVIVVWYLVARALDRRRALRPTRARKIAPVVDTLLLSLGVILFFAGLQEMMYPRYNNPKDALGAFLTLMWSITLIFLSSRRLVRRFARPFFD
jgi:hypothetical protein